VLDLRLMTLQTFASWLGKIKLTTLARKINRSIRSKDQRCRWAYGEISADRVRIHPRCKTVIEGLEKWDYGDRHPLKDVLDAWMYGLKPLWKDSARWAGDTTSSSKSPAGTHRA